MAGLLPSQDTYDPVKNTLEWQIQQGNVQPSDYIKDTFEHNEIAELSTSLLALFKEVVRALSKRTEIPKDARISIERSCSALILWSDDFGIAQGHLNHLFNKSRGLRYATFRNLLHIGRVLVDRLVPVVDMSSGKLKMLCSSVQSNIDAAASLISEGSCRQSDDSSSDGASTFSDDDIFEIAEDLKTDTVVLSDLEPLFKSPIFDPQDEIVIEDPALSSWIPEKHFSEIIGHRFPCADAPLTSHLGRANYERYLRCQAIRDSQEDENQEKEESLPVMHEEKQEGNRASTIVANTMFHDSGVGTSVALTMSYAETMMSYNHDGQSVRIPPLSKEAKSGLPFNCIACGRTVVITNNSAWKRHIYLDLQPYMCLDMSCHYSSSTFGSREEWISHLAGYHGMKPNWESTECPLCGEETGRGRAIVTGHLSKHLEEISLSALPKANSNAESENSPESSDTRSSPHEKANGSVDEDHEASSVEYNKNLISKDYSDPEVINNIIAEAQNLAQLKVKREEAQGAAKSDAIEAEFYETIQEESSSSIEEAIEKMKEIPKETKLAPIRFKDAVGRKFIFPFHLCRTWQGMEDLIKRACVQIDVFGPHIQEGHYDLSTPNGDIILPYVWETVVEPGWDITMSMWPLDKASPASLGPKINKKSDYEEGDREKIQSAQNSINSKDDQNFFTMVNTYFKDQPGKLTRFCVILANITTTEWVPETWKQSCFECKVAGVHVECNAKASDPCTRCRRKRFSCAVRFVALPPRSIALNREQIHKGIVKIGRLCDGYPSFMHEFSSVLPPGYRVEVVDSSEVRLFAPDNEPVKIQMGISEHLNTSVHTETGRGMRTNQQDESMTGKSEAIRDEMESVRSADESQLDTISQVQSSLSTEKLAAIQSHEIYTELNKAGLSESYLDKVKHRFSDSFHVYKQLLQIVQGIQNHTRTAQDTYLAIKELFGSNSDLIDEFKVVKATRAPNVTECGPGTPNEAPITKGDKVQVEDLMGAVDNKGSPNDSNEPQYCLCNRGSTGLMMRCDNVDSCKYKWFHLECVGLATAPSSKVKWYCPDCHKREEPAKPLPREVNTLAKGGAKKKLSLSDYKNRKTRATSSTSPHFNIEEKAEMNPQELGKKEKIPSLGRIKYPLLNPDVYIWPSESNVPDEDESEQPPSLSLPPPPLPPPVMAKLQPVADHIKGYNGNRSNFKIDTANEKPTSASRQDQFAENERLFGLKTDYDENIYTIAIDKDHPQYRKRIAAAMKKAGKAVGEPTSESILKTGLEDNDVDSDVAADGELPQIVVVGDQSADKSSVLEALSAIPFPRDAGSYTRFTADIHLADTHSLGAAAATVKATTNEVATSLTSQRNLAQLTMTKSPSRSPVGRTSRFPAPR